MKRLTVLLIIFSLIFTRGTVCAEEGSAVWFLEMFKKPPVETMSEPLSPYSASAVNFRGYLRSLWEYQVIWTRSYIVSVMSDLDDVSVIEEKLIKNQELGGEAIKPYYGNMFGNILAGLLRQHAVIATEIISATKSGNIEELKKAKKKGRANANRLAFFLSLSRNPLFNKQTLKDLFYKYLDYLEMQAELGIKKDATAEIKAYDDALEQALKIADLLAEGVIRQFPEKFKE